MWEPRSQRAEARRARPGGLFADDFDEDAVGQFALQDVNDAIFHEPFQHLPTRHLPCRQTRFAEQLPCRQTRFAKHLPCGRTRFANLLCR